MVTRVHTYSHPLQWVYPMGVWLRPPSILRTLLMLYGFCLLAGAYPATVKAALIDINSQSEWNAQFTGPGYATTNQLTILNGASILSHAGALSPTQIITLDNHLYVGDATARGTLIINGLVKNTRTVNIYGSLGIHGGSLLNVGRIEMTAGTLGQPAHLQVNGELSTDNFDITGSTGQQGQPGGVAGGSGYDSLSFLQSGNTVINDKLELLGGFGGERSTLAHGQGGRGGMAALYLNGGSLTVKGETVLTSRTSNSGMALLEVNGGDMLAADISLSGGVVTTLSEQAGTAELRVLAGSLQATGLTTVKGGKGGEALGPLNVSIHSGDGVLSVSGGSATLNDLRIEGGDGGNSRGDTSDDGGDGATGRLQVSGGQLTVTGATTVNAGAVGSAGSGGGAGGEGGKARADVSGGTLALEGTSTWDNGSSLNISGGKTIVQNGDWKAGSVLSMNGGTLALPSLGVWAVGANLQVAGGTALMGLSDLNATPTMIPGGSHRAMLLVNSAGLGNVTADLQGATLTLGTGAYTFNADSLTMMEPSGLAPGTPVLTVGSASFSPQSILQAPYEGKNFGDSFTALTATTSLDGVWGKGITNSYFMGLALSRAGTSITATYVRDYMPSISDDTRNLLDEVFTAGADLSSPSVPVAFLTRGTDRRYLDSEPASAAAIEGALHSALLAGTQGVTLAASTMRAEAVGARVSGASLTSTPIHASTGDNAALKGGFAMWLSPLYRDTSVWDMSANKLSTGYTAQLLGLAVGADYTFDNALRLGLALSMGKSHSASQGDFNKTTGKSDYWGASLYGGWRYDNWNLAGDIGYTSNFTNVQQDIPARIGMGNLKGNAHSSALTSGLRAEYWLKTSLLDIIPYVGTRWTQLHTDSHTAKLGGNDLAYTDASTQNIWTFPMGVAWEKIIQTDSGWSFGLRLDTGATAAAGDRKAKSNTTMPGLTRSVEMRMDLMDPWAFSGGAGLEARKKDLSFNISYGAQVSPHTTTHGLYGTAAYEF